MHSELRISRTASTLGVSFSFNALVNCRLLVCTAQDVQISSGPCQEQQLPVKAIWEIVI
jgi:hypothetical protein